MMIVQVYLTSHSLKPIVNHFHYSSTLLRLVCEYGFANAICFARLKYSLQRRCE